MHPVERGSRWIILLLLAIIAARLTYLQLVSDRYRLFSHNNFLRKEVVLPYRGEILDRKGRLMAGNRMAYRLMVVPAFLKMDRPDSLLEILGINRAEWERRLNKARRYSRILPSEVARNIENDQLARLAMWLATGRGLYLEPYWKRYYPDTTTAHITGYLGAVSPARLRADSFYRPGDFYGVRGVERYYEKWLRGKKGHREAIVDVYGRRQGVREVMLPRAGRDLSLTIDLDLQHYARRLLAGRRGAVVAIDPHTGGILAMVSTPDYSADSMMGPHRQEYFRRMQQDTLAPLFHRAVAATYPPGSTVKPMMALIGLGLGVITPAYAVPCAGGYYGQGLHVGCHFHPSPLSVRKAVQYSCNAFFVAVFLRAMQRLDPRPARAYHRWWQAVRRFGIGRPTGIDLPFEAPGFLPDTAYFNRLYGTGRWKGPTVVSLGIGQGEMLMTPLQMAWMVAQLASQGTTPPPHLWKLRPLWKGGQEHMNIPEEHWALVRQAMRDVVRKGTAAWVEYSPIEMAGKTGTAQNPHGIDHSLFIAFAPASRPKIALAVVVENGGFGSSIAAPIASLLVEKYLTDTVTRPALERYCLTYQPKEKTP